MSPILWQGFLSGLKDKIHNPITIVETHSCLLHKWIAMASRILQMSLESEADSSFANGDDYSKKLGVLTFVFSTE